MLVELHNLRRGYLTWEEVLHPKEGFAMEVRKTTISIVIETNQRNNLKLYTKKHNLRIWIFSWSPDYFVDYFGTLQTNWILFWLSGHIKDHPVPQITCSLLDHLDTFQISWTLCRPPPDLLYHLGTTRIIWIFLHCPKWLLNFPNTPTNTFYISKNFLISIADTLTWFFWLWSGVLRRDPATWGGGCMNHKFVNIVTYFFV